jgi:large subunit ribosomal protein L23
MIRYALNTEKGIRHMEGANKLTFVVDRKDSKLDIKKAIEEQFKVKVTKINTIIDLQGTKKAIVTFAPENPAIDVATKIGMM